jgi:hypothetical protein
MKGIGSIGHTTSGVGHAVKSVSGAVKVKAPKPIVPKVGTQHVVPTAQPSGAPQDPSAFIQGLLTSTDPAQAKALIDQIYAPQRQAVNDQIAQLDATAKARADQMSQVYQAFAQYAGGMPSQVQNMYSQGAIDGASLASGMSGPQGDVGSHLQAMSKGDLMQELGANWASYFAAQPHIYSLMATENVKNMLNAATATDAQLRSKLLDLSSQEASQILSYLNDAQAKDTSLQEWAYQQKTAQYNAVQSNALATQKAKAQANQQYLNYLQKQYIANMNYKIATLKLTAQQAKNQTDAWYKRQLIMAKQQGLIDNATYRAQMVALGQGKLKVAQTNAQTSQQRARTAAASAAARTAQTKTASTQKIQAKLNSTKQAMIKSANALKQKSQGSQSQTIYQAADGTQVYKAKGGGYVDGNGKPVSAAGVTATHQSQPALSQDRRGMWNNVYRQYASTLFDYYRYLYPNLATQKGQLQMLVNRAVTNALGWGPKG